MPGLETAPDGEYLTDRFAAIQQLQVRDILVCEVDYFSPKIVLEGWDVFVFPAGGGSASGGGKMDGSAFIQELFPEHIRLWLKQK